MVGLQAKMRDPTMIGFTAATTTTNYASAMRGDTMLIGFRPEKANLPHVSARVTTANEVARQTGSTK